MIELVWLIPALPLAGFLLLSWPGAASASPPPAGWPPLLMGGSFVGRRRRASSACSTGATRSGPSTRSCSSGCRVGGLHVDVGFLVDPLSMTMILFITGVGTLIHLYSIGYMHGDPSFSKFFALPEPLRLLDADAGAGRQPAGHLPRLGGRGHLLLLAHLVLVHREAPTRRPARRPSSPTASVTGASWSPCSSRSPRSGRSNYVDLNASAADHGHDDGHGHRPPALRRGRAASRPRSRCSSGCPTPWPARRRCRP